MKKIVALVLILSACAMADTPPTVRPAPLSRQLRFTSVDYGGPLHTNLQNATWVANRFDGIIGNIGDTSISLINEIKAINTQFKNYYYDLYIRIVVDTSDPCITYALASDTLDMKTWAASNGASFDNMILRATGAGVSVTMGSYLNCPISTSSAIAYNTPAGGVIMFRYYRNSQIRVMFNPFSRDYGRWLAKKFKQSIAGTGADGIMVDEATHISPNANGIDQGMTWPHNPQSAWTSGYDNWTNVPTGNTHTQNRTLANKALSRDTSASWVDGLMDSAEAIGMKIIPNGAGYWGPYNNLNNAYIADTLQDAFDGALVGEYCYAYPTLSSQKQIIKDFISASARWARSSRDIYYDFIYAYTGNFNETGWDTTGIAGFRMKNAVERMKMNLLGFILATYYPGQSTSHYGFKRFIHVYWNNVADDYTSSANGFGGSLSLPDTLTCFDHNWLLWYGHPDSTRTRRTGTDGAGQAYDLYNISLWKDAARTTLQTYAMGRFADGSNHGSTTAVLDTLPTSPTGQWFLVRPMYLNTSAPFLTTPKASGDTVYIKSTEWKIYVADTIQALTFPSGTPSPTSLTLDSLTHDYFGENDSTQSRAVEAGGDSMIYAVGYTSFAALDSSATISTALSTNYRRLSPSGSDTTDTLIILHTNAATNAETYTEYRAVWHKTGSTYGGRVQTSRTFTSSPLAIGAQRVVPIGTSSISGSGVKIP